MIRAMTLQIRIVNSNFVTLFCFRLPGTLAGEVHLTQRGTRPLDSVTSTWTITRGDLPGINYSLVSQE